MSGYQGEMGSLASGALELSLLFFKPPRRMVDDASSCVF